MSTSAVCRRDVLTGQRPTRPRPEIAVPAPDVLDVFGEPVPSDAVCNYVWVLGNYRPVHPELDLGEVVQRWVEAVLRTGDCSAALRVARYLRPAEMPIGGRVSDALGYVATRGLRSDSESGRTASRARPRARVRTCQVQEEAQQVLGAVPLACNSGSIHDGHHMLITCPTFNIVPHREPVGEFDLECRRADRWLQFARSASQSRVRAGRVRDRVGHSFFAASNPRRRCCHRCG
ncbi:hypothetical protein BH11MYX1_BH11MYX1_15360 [soil metagenome]